MAGQLQVKFNNRTYQSPSRAYAALGAQIDKNWKNAAGKVESELRVFMDGVIEALRNRHASPWPGGTSGKTLSTRSGELIQQLSDSERIIGSGNLENLRGVFDLGERLVFHEYGGTKTAAGKMLTIPLPAALDAKGVPLKKSARDWENTFVTTSRAGNLIVFQRRANRIVPLYVLKDSITVKPRLGFREEIASGIPRFVSRMADRVVAELTK